MDNLTYDRAMMLQLNRTYRATREKLFLAWTEPEQLKKWFAVAEGFTVPIAEVDLRVGGTYRIGMKPPGDDAVMIVGGVYRQILLIEKLVFTWRWETPHPNEPETLVTVEFYECGNVTEVVLRHERFTDLGKRDNHLKGWEGCLNQLEHLINEWDLT